MLSSLLNSRGKRKSRGGGGDGRTTTRNYELCPETSRRRGVDARRVFTPPCPPSPEEGCGLSGGDANAEDGDDSNGGKMRTKTSSNIYLPPSQRNQSGDTAGMLSSLLNSQAGGQCVRSKGRGGEGDGQVKTQNLEPFPETWTPPYSPPPEEECGPLGWDNHLKADGNGCDANKWTRMANSNCIPPQLRNQSTDGSGASSFPLKSQARPVAKFDSVGRDCNKRINMTNSNYIPPHRSSDGSNIFSSVLKTQVGSQRARMRAYSGGVDGQTRIVETRQNDPTALLLESTNFQTNFHMNLCRAAKYKVHSPKCTCDAVAKLRTRHAQDTEGLGGLTTSASHDPFDNLIVVPAPDWKSGNPSFTTQDLPSIFICKGTCEESFRTDGFSCEKKLAGEIFSHGTKEGGSNLQEEVIAPAITSVPRFKVSCAKCLLTTHQRNGFAAIVSPSFKELQTMIQRARDAAYAKVQEVGRLHADHTHFTVALELSCLRSLHFGEREARLEVLTQMAAGGVELLKEVIDVFQSKALSAAYPGGMKVSDWIELKSLSSVHFNLGHHLKSWLLLVQEQPRKLCQFVMVVGYIDGRAEFQLDLPGGKRHLGESTLECAVREVEEECSLQLNKTWMANRVSKKYGGLLVDSSGDSEEGGINVLAPREIAGEECMNAFFLMGPPPVK